MYREPRTVELPNGRTYYNIMFDNIRRQDLIISDTLGLNVSEIIRKASKPSRKSSLFEKKNGR